MSILTFDHQLNKEVRNSNHLRTKSGRRPSSDHETLLSLSAYKDTLASSFSATKFVEGFPQSLTKLRAAWKGPCKARYNEYVYHGRGECGPVLDCLIEHGTSELRKTTMASA